MNEITEQLPFSEIDIDIQNYTASVLLLCSANKIISDERITEIRSDLEKAFIETAEQYTKRESSTIPHKRAELLYLSVLYQCDIYLLSLRSLNKAIDELNILPIKIILDRGQKLILNLHEVNLKIFKRAYKSRLSLPCYEYKYVMEKSFDEYCKGYSARFDARNSCAFIDYPLLGCPAYNMKSQGAVFIYEYYTGIMLENEFCKYFSEEKIESLLIKYAKIYNCKYTDLLFNISEILFNNLLAGVLLGKPCFILSLCDNDIDDIIKKYALFSDKALCIEAKKAFSAYQKDIANPQLYQYLRKYIPTFAHELSIRLQRGGMNRFLVIN
ncbi:MAG: DUF6179 domain-containing protein [Oscillospiraceae bacterium]|jgi:hypothetical protein